MLAALEAAANQPLRGNNMTTRHEHIPREWVEDEEMEDSEEIASLDSDFRDDDEFDENDDILLATRYDESLLGFDSEMEGYGAKDYGDGYDNEGYGADELEDE